MGDIRKVEGGREGGKDVSRELICEILKIKK